MATTDTNSAKHQLDVANIERSQRYWESHYAEFQATNSEQFVAVHRQSEMLVAAQPDLPALLADLERQGVSANDVWYQWIRDPRKTYAR